MYIKYKSLMITPKLHNFGLLMLWLKIKYISDTINSMVWLMH